MLEHALLYGKSGYKVFPVNGKIPAIKGWQEAATSDKEKIVELFSIPHTGIGLATGKASGVTVLDVDIKNGNNGFNSLKNAGIELPPTPITLTPSGGRHYFFNYTPLVKNMVGFMDGLDIRNDGGYVILPPSKIGDKVYEFIQEQEL